MQRNAEQSELHVIHEYPAVVLVSAVLIPHSLVLNRVCTILFFTVYMLYKEQSVVNQEGESIGSEMEKPSRWVKLTPCLYWTQQWVETSQHFGRNNQA